MVQKLDEDARAALLAAYQAREGDEAVDALMDEIGL